MPLPPVITALPARVGVAIDTDRLQCNRHWVHLAASDQHPAGWYRVLWLRDTPTGRRVILSNGAMVDTKHGDRAYVLPASAMSAYLADGEMPWSQ